MREGIAFTEELFGRLTPEQRALFSRRPAPGTRPDEWVRQRCELLLALNEESLEEQGEARGISRRSFLAQCSRNSPETFQCVDRGADAENDPECREPLARLDRQVRALRRRGQQVAHPEQRLDSLADDPWPTERAALGPDSLAPEELSPSGPLRTEDLAPEALESE